MENVTQALQHLERTIDMDQPIDADAVLEDHGQWMCTSLENVCLCFEFGLHKVAIRAEHW